MKYLLTTLTTIMAFGMLVFSMPVLAQATDYSQCDGLNGPARGLCKAGTSIGCLGDELDPPACEHITSSYQSITGETPYWVVQCDACPSVPNFDSDVVPNSCNIQTGVVLCVVTRCGYPNGPVQVGEVFYSNQDATVLGSQYTDFNDACR